MNFVTAVQTLIDAEVDIVIIGGWSAILHGSFHTPRPSARAFPSSASRSTYEPALCLG
jgi:hypothetical protein